MPLYDFKCLDGHSFERMVPLVRFGEQQFCGCGSAARRLISATRTLKSDAIDPIRGADGKMHDSLASYRKSLEPGGNPQGERYLEIGDQELKPNLPQFDRAQRRDDIKAALEDVKSGNVPPLTVLED